MPRRIFIAALLLASLSAAPQKAKQPPTVEKQIAAFLNTCGYALRRGPAAEFLNCFDAKMTGIDRITKDVTAMLANATPDSIITILADKTPNPNIPTTHTMSLEWKVIVTSHDSTVGITTRTVNVDTKVEQRDGKWMFTSFTPNDLFRPGPGREAWDLIGSATSQLRNGNAEGFLTAFDHDMPEYNRLVTGINGLVAMGQIDTSLELLSLVGSDAERDMVIDWTTTISQGAFGGQPRAEANITGQRHDKVRLKIELKGKKWLIESIEPLSLFDATPVAR